MAGNFLVKAVQDMTRGASQSFKSTSPMYETGQLINPGDYRGVDHLTWFFGMAPNGGDVVYDYNGLNSAVRAYGDCPTLAAVINRKAQAYANGELRIVNSQGNDANSDPAKKIKKLMMQPNPMQNWDEFEAQGYVYRQLFGYSIVRIIKPIGFKENIDAVALWNLPPFMLTIKETKKLFAQRSLSEIIQSVKLTYNGITEDVPVDEIFIMRDYIPSFNSLLFPESRIKAIRQNIRNIIGGLESRGMLIRFRGARGIFTQEPDPLGVIPVTKPEKDEIQQAFGGYGLMGGQHQFVVTRAALKYQAIGQAVKDMMLLEEELADKQAICDAYGYPDELLSREKGVTFANKSEAGKLLYQNTIIPEAKSDYKQWNKLFDTDKYNLNIYNDYSQLEVMQEDREKLAKTRLVYSQALEREFRNGKLTLNEWRQEVGQDKLKDDDGRGDLLFPEYAEIYGDPMKGIAQPTNADSTGDNPQNNNNG